MALRLESAMNCSVRVKGQGGPQIVVEMEYLPELSSNRRLTRNRFTGQTVLRDSVKRWMEQLAWMVRVYQNSTGIVFKIPLRIKIDGEFRTKKVPDVHNLIKPIADAIENALGINDKYYSVECGVSKTIRGCQSKLIVTIGEQR
jgi:Holliday junction resolvase RusA-like endonuclease